MEGSRRKSLSVPRLFLLLSFLLSPLPSWSQAQNLNCFVCDLETNPKCEEALSSSDTELIQECPEGKGGVAATGCQVLLVHSRLYDHPRHRFIWRGCLYPSDVETYEFPPDDPWYSGKIVISRGSHLSGPNIVNEVNDERKSFGLPLLPMKSYFHNDKSTITFVFNYFIHPYPKNWNVSNGVAANTLFPGFKVTPMRNVKCFVCTDEDPGCEGQLTSPSPFIKDCVGSVETTVPIGCHIIAGKFEYPDKIKFYRDCLYENYLRYHSSFRSKTVINKEGENWKEVKGHFIYLDLWLENLNTVRSYLGLKGYKLTAKNSKLSNATPAVHSYFLPGEPEPGRGHEHTKKFFNQPNLSNGVAIEGIIKEEPTPPEFKVKGTFSCHSCDTQTGGCGGNKSEIGVIKDLPQEQCMTDDDDAYGCMILYTVVDDTSGDDRYKTKWMRRGCWYKGDFYCLKSLTPPSGRSAADGSCPPRKCDGRKLIKEGKTVSWEGERDSWRWPWDKKAYEEIISCLRNVRIRLGVSETLPELPKYEDMKGDDMLNYIFCAGRTLCNDKVTPNVHNQYIPPPPGPPPSPEPPPPPGPDPCDDEMNGDDCEIEDKEDSALSTTTWVLIGVLVPLAIIGIGAWVFTAIKKKRARRDEPASAPRAPEVPGLGPRGYPVTNYQPMQQPSSPYNPNMASASYPYQPMQQAQQWNSKGPMMMNYYQPGQQPMNQINSSGSMAIPPSAHSISNKQGRT